jgi:hypothetical protein
MAYRQAQGIVTVWVDDVTGIPTQPIYHPVSPDQGLPGSPGRPDQGLPPFPDQGLPGFPGRPDQGLPGSPERPDQGLPPQRAPRAYNVGDQPEGTPTEGGTWVVVVYGNEAAWVYVPPTEGPDIDEPFPEQPEETGRKGK